MRREFCINGDCPGFYESEDIPCRVCETPRKTPAHNSTDSARRISGDAERAAASSTAPDRAHE